MALLTKEQILAADDLTVETVAVPEWGGEVLVKALTAKQRGLWTKSLVDQRRKQQVVKVEEVQIRLCALSIVDESGRAMFGPKDLNALAGKSAGALQRVFEAAQRLSGLTDEDIEELAGNSEEILNDDSPSS